MALDPSHINDRNTKHHEGTNLGRRTAAVSLKALSYPDCISCLDMNAQIIYSTVFVA